MHQFVIAITASLAICGIPLFGLNWITNGRIGFGNEKFGPAVQAFMAFFAMNLFFITALDVGVVLLGNIITGHTMTPDFGGSSILVGLATFIGTTSSLTLSRKWFPETVHIPNTISSLLVAALLTFLLSLF